MATSFASLVKRFARDDRGASLVEYAVLIGLITTVLIGGIALLSGNIDAAFRDIAAVVGGTSTGAGGGGN